MLGACKHLTACTFRLAVPRLKQAQIHQFYAMQLIEVHAHNLDLNTKLHVTDWGYLAPQSCLLLLSWSCTCMAILHIVSCYFHIEICTECRIKEHDMRLMLWDTAGQEEFDAITKAYYRGMLKG